EVQVLLRQHDLGGHDLRGGAGRAADVRGLAVQRLAVPVVHHVAALGDDRGDGGGLGGCSVEGSGGDHGARRQGHADGSAQTDALNAGFQLRYPDYREWPYGAAELRVRPVRGPHVSDSRRGVMVVRVSLKSPGPSRSGTRSASWNGFRDVSLLYLSCRHEPGRREATPCP